jgi:hypothetical protein
MAKRGPKGYDAQDRPLVIDALKLMRDRHFSAPKAAKQVDRKDLAGVGDPENRQKRLERKIKERIGSGSPTAIEQAIIIEQIILDTGTVIDYSGIIPPKRPVSH